MDFIVLLWIILLIMTVKGNPRRSDVRFPKRLRTFEGAAIVLGLLGEHIESRTVSHATGALTKLKMDGIEAPLRRMYVDSNAKCNDGSDAGYYARISSNSKQWVIFLEGGWYCFDFQSCKSRWESNRHLMSSVNWPDSKHVDGILSTDPKINPHWWNANHVYIPYCSSDCWSGTSFGNASHSSVTSAFKSTPSRDYLGATSLHFSGSLILEAVIKDLNNLGLRSQHSAVLAGSSAGGIGVMLNIDRVKMQLESMGSDVDVRGIADSAWFLDNEPYTPVTCHDALSCATITSIRKGFRTWKGRMSTRCRAKYMDDPWKCYLGYKVLPFIHAPVFIFQWIFDEAQMFFDNVGKPVSKAQWNYIHNIGNRIKSSLRTVKATFAPSCISHASLTNPSWSKVVINGVSLTDALQCWALDGAIYKQNNNTLNTNTMRNELSEVQSSSYIKASATLISNDDRYAILPASSRTEEAHAKKRKRNKRRNWKKSRDCRKCNVRKQKRKAQSKISYGDSPQLNMKQFIKNSFTPNVQMMADSPLPNSSHVELTKLKYTQKGEKRNKKHKRNKRRCRIRKQNSKGLTREEKRKLRRRQKRCKMKRRKQLKNKQRKKKCQREAIRLVRSSRNVSNQIPKGREHAPTLVDASAHIQEVYHHEVSQKNKNDRCSYHFIDTCTWPHCNPTCPPLINPYSGKEMSRVQLLKSFGLNMQDFAHALGVDLPTLKAMDNDDIVLILST